MEIKLAEYIADFLVEKGVAHCFTLTGGGAMHLNDAFGHKEGLLSVYNHHEQGSAIAAEGYARASGKIPLLCVTSGPGGTNALTGVLGAWLDSIPMIVISGQVKSTTTVSSTDLPLRQLGDQEYPIKDLAVKMTKYATMITDPKTISYHLEKAFFLATNGRRGPVWLDIPLDIQAATIDTSTLEHFDSRYDAMHENPVYDTRQSKIILEKLSQAKRPVILAGEGLQMSNMKDLFLKFAEKLGIPVLTAWNAHDVIDDENPVYCGRPGTLGTRGGNFIAQKSDLMLILGCRLNIRQISYEWKRFSPNAYKIMVDIDAAELFKPTLTIDMPIHANLADVIPSLLQEVQDKSFNYLSWTSHAKALNKKYPAVSEKFHKKDTPVNPYVFIEKLSAHWKSDEIIVTGNGSACVITFQAAKIKQGQRLFTNSGVASMGYAIPAALGAAVATKQRIIAIDGEGSFMMNLQELQTISQNRLNIKIFLLNNGGYHSIRQTQKNLFSKKTIGIGPESEDLSFPDFEKLSDAFNFSYFCIDKISHSDEIIQKMLQCKGPSICEVILDQDQFFEPKLSSRILPDGKIVSPDIDDMFPFLERDEYNNNREMKNFKNQEY